jgi:hypothetical protein
MAAELELTKTWRFPESLCSYSGSLEEIHREYLKKLFPKYSTQHEDTDDRIGFYVEHVRHGGFLGHFGTVVYHPVVYSTPVFHWGLFTRLVEFFTALRTRGNAVDDGEALDVKAVKITSAENSVENIFNFLAAVPREQFYPDRRNHLIGELAKLLGKIPELADVSND